MDRERWISQLPVDSVRGETTARTLCWRGDRLLRCILPMEQWSKNTLVDQQK